MKSFVSYLGGKSLLANKIIPQMPEHTCYCEVFAGAAWMLFKKEESQVEIINDINADLCTLYRVIKHHMEAFVQYLKWVLIARDEFERFKSEAPESLTDIQRAVRFYYLLRMGFGGKIVNPALNISATRRPALNFMRLEEELSEVHLRLCRVYIENKPYQKLIERYDKPGTFFYLDPPYYGFENCYGNGIFNRNDFTTLRDLLAAIQGKFILSINNTPEIRKLFGQFEVEMVATTYTAAGGNKRVPVKELLIKNY